MRRKHYHLHAPWQSRKMPTDIAGTGASMTEGEQGVESEKASHNATG